MKNCNHDVVLLGNRDLSSGKGVCADCHEMIPVNIREPQWAVVFAAVRLNEPARASRLTERAP